MIKEERGNKGCSLTTFLSLAGRYCVLIEWKVNPTEEWCRYIVKAGAEYYATRSDKTGTEKVYKLSISK